MIKWKQASHKKDRYIADIGPAKLIVEQREQDPGVWYAWSLPAIIADQAMMAKELDAAKSEAVALLSSRCLAIVRACE
jgi:hypothetical protein